MLNDHTFELGYGQYKPAMYVFVKNATRYIAGAVLVGRYRDLHGRSYEFRQDGWAVFPKRRFRYEIGVDHVLNPYDYFYKVGKDGKMWAFRWDGDNLQIFRTSSSHFPEQIVDTHPVFTLEPVRSPAR